MASSIPLVCRGEREGRKGEREGEGRRGEREGEGRKGGEGRGGKEEGEGRKGEREGGIQFIRRCNGYNMSCGLEEEGKGKGGGEEH